MHRTLILSKTAYPKKWDKNLDKNKILINTRFLCLKRSVQGLKCWQGGFKQAYNVKKVGLKSFG